MVGVIVHDITDPYFSEVVRASRTRPGRRLPGHHLQLRPDAERETRTSGSFGRSRGDAHLRRQRSRRPGAWGGDPASTSRRCAATAPPSSISRRMPAARPRSGSTTPRGSRHGAELVGARPPSDRLPCRATHCTSRARPRGYRRGLAVGRHPVRRAAGGGARALPRRWRRSRVDALLARTVVTAISRRPTTCSRSGKLGAPRRAWHRRPGSRSRSLASTTSRRQR